MTENTIKKIEERIARVTNSKLTKFDLFNYSLCTKANRRTRMELVAWILINKHNYLLEDGFVRDWIVGGNENWKNGVQLYKVPLGHRFKEDITDNDISPKGMFKF